VRRNVNANAGLNGPEERLVHRQCILTLRQELDVALTLSDRVSEWMPIALEILPTRRKLNNPAALHRQNKVNSQLN